MEYLMALPLAFLAGAFPTSYFAGKLLRGIDLREHGSGNLGATNIYRVMGPGPAVAVLVVDIFKGFAPVFWLPRAIGLQGEMLLMCTLAVAAVLGHVFSPFVGFRGGKGVATAAGVILAICPAAIGICLLAWALVFAIFRIVSVASLTAALALPPAIWFTLDRSAQGFGTVQVFGLALAAGVFYTHRSNIGRLLRGEEKRLSRGGGDRR
jgi:glycerol-3-phosphate acyltransferase PlsY